MTTDERAALAEECKRLSDKFAQSTAAGVRLLRTPEADASGCMEASMDRKDLHAAIDRLAALPVQAEPAAWVSPEQFAEHDPQATGKPRYLPILKRSEGKFTMALYAGPTPPGSHATPAQAGPDTQEPDAIARSKRILALVDDYHERPTSDTRHTLRCTLMDEFAKHGAASPPDQCKPDHLTEFLATGELRREVVENYDRHRKADQCGQTLSPAQIEAGWRDTFSTDNPFCPCNLKTFTKAARWAEATIAKSAL